MFYSVLNKPVGMSYSARLCAFILIRKQHRLPYYIETTKKCCTQTRAQERSVQCLTGTTVFDENNLSNRPTLTPPPTLVIYLPKGEKQIYNFFVEKL